MRKYLYWASLIILLYVFAEGMSYGGLFILSKFSDIRYEPADMLSNRHRNILSRFINEEAEYNKYSPVLGWTIKEKGVLNLYRANSSGIRSNREYDLSPPGNVIRISAFGDSFTHCDEVKNDETWQATIENLDSGLEVINFGVGGYGLDQAYLRYLTDGKQYNSHIVLIGFMTENIYRSINRYRPFYFHNSRMPLIKPRYIIKKGKLMLLHNPMKSLDDYRALLINPRKVLNDIGMYDYHYQRRYKTGAFDWSPTARILKISNYKIRKMFSDDGIIVDGSYNESSEAFKVIKGIFDEFYTSVIQDNSVPVIIIFPNKRDLIYFDKYKEKRYAPLIMTIFNPEETNYSLKELFPKQWHYSALANRLVGEHIRDYLIKNGHVKRGKK
jgi:hypothetical protein